MVRHSKRRLRTSQLVDSPQVSKPTGRVVGGFDREKGENLYSAKVGKMEINIQRVDGRDSGRYEDVMASTSMEENIG